MNNPKLVDAEDRPEFKDVLIVKDVKKAERAEHRYRMIRSMTNMSTYIGAACLLLFFTLRLFPAASSIRVPGIPFTFNRVLLIVAVNWLAFLLVRVIVTVQKIFFSSEESGIFMRDVGESIKYEEKRNMLFLETAVGEFADSDSFSTVYMPIVTVTIRTSEETKKPVLIRIGCWLEDHPELLSFEFSLDRYTEESVQKMIDLVNAVAEEHAHAKNTES